MAPPDFPAGGYLRDYLVFWAVWALLVAGTAVFFVRTRGRTGRARLVAGNALVTASLLWTVVLAAETWLRYVYDATDSYGLTLTNFSWFRRHVILNSIGLRDREMPAAKPRGAYRVACVGDSFTLGYGVPDAADAWPQRLHRDLSQRTGGRVEAWNFGIVGLQTGEEAQIVEGLRADRDVDHVLLGYCLNDLDDLLPPGRGFDRATAPRPPLVAPTFSFVADFLWFRLALARDPRVAGYFDWVLEGYRDPRVWEAQRARFARMRLDVVVFPFFSDWGPDYRFDRCHDQVAAAWRELGVGVLDLRAAYFGRARDDLVVNRFDAHPNALAHRLAADAIEARVFEGRDLGTPPR